MKQVIIDTNFFLIPVQFHIDIFSEIHRLIEDKYEMAVLEKSLDEMRKIILEQKGKDKAAAKMALQLAERIKVIKTEDGQVDDLIVELTNEDTYVCTQDKALRDRVKEKKGKTIVMRQKEYLIIN